MLDTKKMLQDGFKKVQVAVLVETDRNGKQHLIIVDSLDNAKIYKSCGDVIQLATMYIKT